MGIYIAIITLVYMQAQWIWLLCVCVCTCACTCMCLSPRLLINIGMMWPNIDPYGFHTAAVVSIIVGMALAQPNKSKPALYKPLLSL